MKKSLLAIACVFVSHSTGFAVQVDEDSSMDLTRVKQFEQRRIDTINNVIGSVIAIYGEERQGGGSGVIIDPSGIGLTNHHVIMGVGVSGWGGLADGELYRWDLIGTDPGGDVAIIQMKGNDEFPFTPLADSDQVQVGDWALAMGNPFVLTEDQVPTVTLGIVSGVKRYQPGAGQNQLVYGNCIQTDSSINPGNSGGPLFNMQGRVIGINGRGSFKERGRVNVGLGYAISSNQIKNFIPDLLATKLVEHGTLDANFEDRAGKVVCSNLYEDSKLYEMGVRPGDELLEFEGEVIKTANQFTNLICTLPEDWPASLTLQGDNGEEKNINIRLYGLPYKRPKRPQIPENQKDQTPEQKEQIKRANAMVELLSAPPGIVRLKEVNSKYANHIVSKWQQVANENSRDVNNESEQPIHRISPDRIHNVWTIVDRVLESDQEVGTQKIKLASNGTFEVTTNIGKESTCFRFDGNDFYEVVDQKKKDMSLVEFKLCQPAIQAMMIAATNQQLKLDLLGGIVLDGSDKATRKNSYRLKFDDKDGDAFFLWLSMQDQNSNEHVSLLKASSNMDCVQDDGGIVFKNWVDEQGLHVARRREVVFGLAESSKRVFLIKSVTREPVDEAALWTHWQSDDTPTATPEK